VLQASSGGVLYHVAVADRMVHGTVGRVELLLCSAIYFGGNFRGESPLWRNSFKERNV